MRADDIFLVQTCAICPEQYDAKDKDGNTIGYDKIDVAALLYKAADALRWQEEILKLPSCNDCGKLRKCEYEPPIGHYVRINCPHWAKSRGE